MGSGIDEVRNKKLIDVIYQLSDPNLSLKSTSKRREIYTIFEEVYWKGSGEELYRHLYSDLFDVIISIDKSEINDVEILIQNIQSLCLNYNPSNSKVKELDIGEALVKLYDHISLDVKRLQYTKAINYEQQRTVFEVANNVITTERNVKKEIRDTVREVQKDFEQEIAITIDAVQEKNGDELSKMRTEYVSILGIFSSIVLAFVGGMTFSASVLENINKASAYRMILITLIIGLVFFNIIWVLLDFIKDMSEKKYIWIVVNTLLVLGIIASCFAYKYDWFAREEQVTQQMQQEVVSENSISENSNGIESKD